MTLNDKVQVGDSTTGTSTSTSTTWHCPYTQPKAEQGWECPRCGRINAPWVRQCDCSPSTYTVDKITVNPCNDWWKSAQITCDDTFKIHPDSITYTNMNQVAGGSDYKDSITGNWVNVPKTYTNSVKR